MAIKRPLVYYDDTKQMEFLRDADSLYSGDAVIDKLADQVFNTTLFVNDNTLIVPVLANTIYTITFYIIYQSAATTTGARFAISGPVTPSLVFFESKKQATIGTTVSTDMFNTGIITAYDTPLPVSTTEISANLNLHARLEGVFKSGITAGNLVLRVLSSVNASNVTVKMGSYVKYRAI